MKILYNTNKMTTIIYRGLVASNLAHLLEIFFSSQDLSNAWGVLGNTSNHTRHIDKLFSYCYRKRISIAELMVF